MFVKGEFFCSIQGFTAVTQHSRSCPQRALIALLGAAFTAILRLLHWTWRVSSEGVEQLDAALERKEKVLVVFWHGAFPPLFVLLSARQACVLVSQSFRGQVIAEVGRRFGYQCISIPDRRRDPLPQTIGALMAHCPAGAIAVDGPCGPYHQVKRGAARLASASGYLLMPVSVAARRSKVFRRRWDRLRVPLPLTRVHLLVGRAIRLPPGLNERQLDLCSKRIGEALVETERCATERIA